MALEVEVPCMCVNEWYLDMHPSFRNLPSLCPWCHGAKKHPVDVYFEHYSGEFGIVDWRDICDYQDDIYMAFECQCGDRISFTEGGENRACKCGRIYRLSVKLEVDETGVGDTQSIIDLFLLQRGKT